MRCWEIFKMHNKKIYLSPRLSTVVSRRHTSGRKDEKTFEYLITNTGPSISESIRWWKKESEESKQQINFFPHLIVFFSLLCGSHFTLIYLERYVAALCISYSVCWAASRAKSPVSLQLPTSSLLRHRLWRSWWEARCVFRWISFMLFSAALASLCQQTPTQPHMSRVIKLRVICCSSFRSRIDFIFFFSSPSFFPPCSYTVFV